MLLDFSLVYLAISGHRSLTIPVSGLNPWKEAHEEQILNVQELRFMRLIKALGMLAVIAVLGACNRTSDSAAGGSTDARSHGSGRGSSTSTAQNVDNTTASPQRAVGLSPEDEGASKADLEITRQIRQTINSDPEFSPQAKEVQVVTVNGKVTLRGPVRNVQEQRAIASIARRAEGVSSVNNQLEVKITNP